MCSDSVTPFLCAEHMGRCALIVLGISWMQRYLIRCTVYAPLVQSYETRCTAIVESCAQILGVIIYNNLELLCHIYVP